MFKRFFASEFFENKFYFARKHISLLNKQYKNAHGLAKGWEDSDLSEKAATSLKHIKDASLTRHEKKYNTKVIWMYWNSALEASPEVVNLSYKSWEIFNPEYEVILLNDHLLEEKLGFDFNAVFELCNIRLTLANKADLLRLYLLSQYGGVWVDATSFCIKPLDEWLPDVARKSGFFAFRQDRVKSRPIEVWFMYAEKGSLIVQDTLSLFIDHLTYGREVSVFVSNSKKKMRKLGIEKNYPCKLYAETVYDAELFGFMPYFSLSYFLNESMNKLLSDAEMEQFFCLPNFFANNNDAFEVFANSYVSKQTYKGDYQNDNVYMKRRSLLLSMLSRYVVDGQSHGRKTEIASLRSQ